MYKKIFIISVFLQVELYGLEIADAVRADYKEDLWNENDTYPAHDNMCGNMVYPAPNCLTLKFLDFRLATLSF